MSGTNFLLQPWLQQLLQLNKAKQMFLSPFSKTVRYHIAESLRHRMLRSRCKNDAIETSALPQIL